MEAELSREIEAILAELRAEVPSLTDAAIAEGRCRLIVDDELANTDGDNAPSAASSPPA